MEAGAGRRDGVRGAVARGGGIGPMGPHHVGFRELRARGQGPPSLPTALLGGTARPHAQLNLTKLTASSVGTCGALTPAARPPLCGARPLRALPPTRRPAQTPVPGLGATNRPVTRTAAQLVQRTTWRPVKPRPPPWPAPPRGSLQASHAVGWTVVDRQLLQRRGHGRPGSPAGSDGGGGGG